MTIALPQWQEARKRRSIITSATQYETWERCKRLWWLSKVRRLPTPPTKAQVFGTVLHAVAERYLLADDQGRDENGNPVDLYPDGWHIARDRFKPDQVEGEIDVGQQDLVKRLITAAIDEGILCRGAERAVERGFREIVLTVDQCGTKVEIVGFIDLEYVAEIHDHKTTGNMRYAKSPEALAENTQALIYAAMHLRALRATGAAVPEEILLRHNYYCKDALKPEVRKVEVRVPVSVVLAKWEEIEGYSAEMVRLRDTIEDGLTEIPDPENPAKACNMYGGCAYTTICGGRETEDEYLRRLDKMSKSGHTTGGVTPRGATREAIVAGKDQTAMGTDFASALGKKKAIAAAAGNATTAPATIPAKVKTTTPPPAATTPEPEPETTAPPAAEAPTGDAPPWAIDGCMACGGSGFDSEGQMCRICQHKTAKAGGSVAYALEALGDGNVAWTNPETGAAGVSPLPGHAAEPKVTAKAAVVAPAAPAEPETPEAPAEPEAAPAAAAAAEEPAETPEPKSRGKGGRPKKGFMLCVNCAPSRPTPGQRQGSGRYVYYLHEVLRDLKVEMATDMGVDSFYDIDFFQRRDMMARVGEALAERFQTDIVVCENVGTGPSDLKHLLDAIRPFAGMVMQGHA